MKQSSPSIHLAIHRPQPPYEATLSLNPSLTPSPAETPSCLMAMSVEQSHPLPHVSSNPTGSTKDVLPQATIDPTSPRFLHLHPFNLQIWVFVQVAQLPFMLHPSSSSSTKRAWLHRPQPHEDKIQLQLPYSSLMPPLRTTLMCLSPARTDQILPKSPASFRE